MGNITRKPNPDYKPPIDDTPMTDAEWAEFEKLSPEMAKDLKDYNTEVGSTIEDEFGMTPEEVDSMPKEALDTFRQFHTDAKELERSLKEQDGNLDIDELEQDIGRPLTEADKSYIKKTSQLNPELESDKAKIKQAEDDYFEDLWDSWKTPVETPTPGESSITQIENPDFENGTWEDIDLGEQKVANAEFDGFPDTEITKAGDINFTSALESGAIDSVEFGVDGAVTVNGIMIDSATEAGATALEALAEVGASSARYAMVAAGMEVLGVLGAGYLLYDVVSHIVEDQRLNTLYNNEGDKYVDNFFKLKDSNAQYLQKINSSSKVNNQYTKLYYKYILSSSNPDKMIMGQGHQIPEFTYKSDYVTHDEAGHAQLKYTYAEIDDKIENAMMSGIYESQTAELFKEKNMMLHQIKKTQFEAKNRAIKIRIEEGLKRVRNGTTGVKQAGFHPADNMRTMYDAVMENKQRQKFLETAYGDFRGEENMDKKVSAMLGTPDNRMKQHFQEQAKSLPGYQDRLLKKTNTLNKTRNFWINQEFNKGKQAINVKYMKIEKALRNLPLGMGLPQIKKMEQKRVAEWKSLNNRQGRAQKNFTEQDVEMGYIPKGMYKELGDPTLPFWLTEYMGNRKGLMESDITEARKNQIKWEINKRRMNHKAHADDEKTKIPPPEYHGGDDGDYNKFIDPTTDIKRKLRKPDKPAPEPVLPTPDPKPKPKPLPPHLPRNNPTRRRLLGDDETYIMESERENNFDKDIAFDSNIALHLLRLCEHSYKAFDTDEMPPSEVYDYDISTTIGDEGMGKAEQGRMYYSTEDNIISIAYRGTDFGRVSTRPDLFVADLIRDIDMRQTHYEGLLVHTGFLDFYLNTQVEVMSFIKQYVNGDTLIYTTGHSLGAIPSQLLAYIINKHYGERKAINYTFGSPRGLDRPSAKIMATQITSFRIADIQDPITLLPPSGRYFHTGRTIYLDEKIMKEILDMDEADRLYNIAGSTVAGVISYQALSVGIIGLLKYVGTPEQSSLSTRMGGMFYNMYQTGITNLSPTKMGSNIKNFFGWVLASMSKSQERRSIRQGSKMYQMGRQISQFQKDTIVNRFIGRSNRVGTVMRNWDLDGLDWIDFMKNEGLKNLHEGKNIFKPSIRSSHAKATWTDGFFKKIHRADKSYTRTKVEGFLLEMEMMMFPDKIVEYQDLMKSWNLGFLLNVFPTKVQLKSSALTVGGVFALFKILQFSVFYPMSFIELNKHSLEKYDELLSSNGYSQKIKGESVRTPKEMLQNQDAVKDNDGKFYSKTPSVFGDKPIFSQTDNPHLFYLPHYHKETGLIMRPIPHDLRGAIIGFVVLSDEQYHSPNILKGICVY